MAPLNVRVKVPLIAPHSKRTISFFWPLVSGTSPRGQSTLEQLNPLNPRSQRHPLIFSASQWGYSTCGLSRLRPSQCDAAHPDVTHCPCPEQIVPSSEVDSVSGRRGSSSLQDLFRLRKRNVDGRAVHSHAGCRLRHLLQCEVLVWPVPTRQLQRSYCSYTIRYAAPGGRTRARSPTGDGDGRRR